MQKTSNLGLNKPEGTDVVNIEDLNANADILDAKLGPSGHSHDGTPGNGPKIAYSNITGTPTAFGNVKVGDTTIQADSKSDTLEIVNGANITVTPDATNDRLTIAVTGTVPNATTAAACTGNAATATKLATARTIALTGDVTGSGSFDGSGNLTITATVKSADPLGVPKPYFGVTLPSRHLWCNGATIGDKNSGATYAGSATEDLFYVLWYATGLAIYTSDGSIIARGDSAATDFIAHKRLAVPDLRGRALIGLDNLGGTSANIVTNSDADVLGGKGGTENHTLTIEQMPSHNHSHIRSILSVVNDTGKGNRGGGPMTDYTGYTGGGQAHPNMQPWIACNYIMRY